MINEVDMDGTGQVLGHLTYIELASYFDCTGITTYFNQALIDLGCLSEFPDDDGQEGQRSGGRGGDQGSVPRVRQGE